MYLCEQRCTPNASLQDLTLPSDPRWVKASKAKDSKAKLRSAISKVIVRNPLLQQAAKNIFSKMK